MAAAHLTPEIVGTITGISILLHHQDCQQQKQRQQQKERKFIQTVLKERHNIKSNRIDGEWTGVSLARWVDLIENLRPLMSPLGGQKDIYDGNDSIIEEGIAVPYLETLLSSAIWSVATYEVCQEAQQQQSQLQYLLSLHETLSTYHDIVNIDKFDSSHYSSSSSSSSSTNSNSNSNSNINSNSNNNNEIILNRASTKDEILNIWNADNSYVNRGIQWDETMQKEWISKTRMTLNRRHQAIQRPSTSHNASHASDDQDTITSYDRPATTSLKKLLEAVLIDYEKDDHIIDSYHDHSDVTGRIEDLLLAIINHRKGKEVKPVTPNSYYSYDGGDPKPDCVEVCIRELIDYLLWDEQTGSFDTSRLPKATASPILYQLYSPIVKGSDNRDVTKGSSVITNEAHLIATCRGQEWFNMLSDIPTCQYLSESPNAGSYELTPTLRNVAKVIYQLLLNKHNPKSKRRHERKDDSVDETMLVDGVEEEWESLSQLQDMWSPEALLVTFDTLTEKGKMSHEIIVHEIANIKIPKRKNVIELRLRMDWQRNTGFATVTHFRVVDEPLDSCTANRLLFQATNITNTTRKAPHKNNADMDKKSARETNRRNTILPGFVALSLLGDAGLLDEKPEKENSHLLGLALSILSCRYGSHRQDLMSLSSTTDLEREERAYESAFRNSRFILKNGIIQICDYLSLNDDNENPSTATSKELLMWLLSESPELSSLVQEEKDVVKDNMNSSSGSMKHLHVDSKIEKMILQLPPNLLLEDDKFLSILDTNWSVRGKLIRKVIAWSRRNRDHPNSRRDGIFSMTKESIPTFREIPGFISLIAFSRSLYNWV